MVSEQELEKQKQNLTEEITDLIVKYKRKEITFNEYNARKNHLFKKLSEINSFLE